MKKIGIIICMALSCMATSGQTAKNVLDKAAATISVKEGVRANFRMTGGMGTTNGSIAIKGEKFHATTPQAIIWFDGKTQWTYVKDNEEVNVSTPNEAQLQAINPYNFIHLYKQGYKASMVKSGNNYVVLLKATKKEQKIRELYVTVDKSSYIPSQVRILQGKKWIVFDISGLKKQNIPDSEFRFNAKDFPKAEIIDLR